MSEDLRRAIREVLPDIAPKRIGSDMRLQNLVVAARLEGAAEERQKAADWLRQQLASDHSDVNFEDTVHDFADAIERGDHLK